MPATLLERIVAVMMLGASAALLLLVLREVRKEEAQPPAAAAQESAPAQTQSTLSTSAPTGSTEPATTTPELSGGTTPTSTTARRVATRLVLTATAQTWLDARAGSAQGRVLYVGFLSEGQSIALRAQRIWVRFGSASNLVAELNGEPLALGPGTYSALISPSGLEFLGA